MNSLDPAAAMRVYDKAMRRAQREVEDAVIDRGLRAPLLALLRQRGQLRRAGLLATCTRLEPHSVQVDRLRQQLLGLIESEFSRAREEA